MEIGFVGLGKMGMNMVERLRRDNHKIVAFDLEAEKLEEVSTFGADGVDSLKAMVSRLKAPRASPFHRRLLLSHSPAAPSTEAE